MFWQQKGVDAPQCTTPCCPRAQPYGSPHAQPPAPPPVHRSLIPENQTLCCACTQLLWHIFHRAVQRCSRTREAAAAAVGLNGPGSLDWTP